MSNGIKIGVQANFDSADVDKGVAKLNEQMNRLAQSVANANKVKFSPVDKGSLDALKQIEARFNELKKVSGGLRDRIKATGQGASSFSDIDWTRMYEDPVMRQKKMQQAFQHVTAGSGYSVRPAAAPAGGGAVPQQQQPQHSGGGFSSVFGGAANAGLRAAGPVGGVVANAGAAGMAGGMAGGMSAGVMGLLGGFAALAVGKGVSAVKGKVDAAGQEGVGYDTLKRTLGDVNVSFGLLRESLRAASYDIGVTFEESQKLGTDFAKLSGISKEQYKTIADEVSVGGGFGRSVGMDPSQSNQFFAQMRQFKVTEDTNGSRKLALMIGEAVGKSGSFAKADEMMAAIASFTSNQARAGLATPNVEGYAGALSGLVGSKIPGLDPQGAASLLNRLNGSIMNGGSNGEAGNNFMYSVLGKKHGLDPVQTMLLEQQGAFGTGRGAFGSDLYKKFTGKFGGGVSGAAANDGEMNISAILAGLQSQYKGNPSMLLNATARTLGINETQAMAVHSIGTNDLRGTTGRMSRLGLDFSKMSGTGMLATSAIEGGSHADLVAQADALKASKKQPLDKDEAEQLRKALAGNDEGKLKDILTQLTYTREQEMTEGKATLQAIQNVEKRTQELATGMVGPMNEMRNAMVYMAGGGKRTPSQLKADIANLQYQETSDPLKARRAEIDRLMEDGAIPKDGVIRGGRSSHKLTKAEIEDKKKYLSGLQAERDDIDTQLKDATDVRAKSINSANVGAGATPELLAELAKADKDIGFSPGTSAAVWQTESKFNPNARSKRGARGMAQILPDTQTSLESRYGRKFDPSDKDDSLFMYTALMKENMAHFGNQDDSLRGYNGGWDKSKWPNAETSGYVPKVNSSRGLFSTPMPEGTTSQTSTSQAQEMKVEGHFTLAYPNGTTAANPIIIKKVIRPPSSSGSTVAQR